MKYTIYLNGKIMDKIRDSFRPGGYIESRLNLSQEGTCWVHSNGISCENARIQGSAQVWGHVSGFAVVRGNVADGSMIAGHALVLGTRPGRWFPINYQFRKYEIVMDHQ